MSKAWLAALPLLVFLVAGILAAGEAPKAWAVPVADDGGSTIPIPPPEPPTPVPSDTDSNSPSISGVADGGFSLERLQFSPSVRMRTVDGRRVEALESAFVVGLDPSGMQTIALPVALPAGAELDELRDLASGIEWEPGPAGSMRGILLLPLGGEEAILAISLEQVRGSGRRMEGVISGVELVLAPGSTGPELPLEGEVRLTAELRRLPRNIDVSVKEVEAADPELMSSLDAAAAASQVLVGEVAYAVTVEVLSGDDEAESIVGTVSVEMRVAESWADRWPEGAVRIVKVNGQGEAGILQTTSLGVDGLGRAGYLATSQEGFSTFALAALQDSSQVAQGRGSSSLLWLGVALGSVAVLTMAGVLIILRFRVKAT
ncbi:MAG: hypothetical protein ACE5JL_08160 [Dehalococcoidia bacterium]